MIDVTEQTRCDPPHGFDATWETGGSHPSTFNL